MNWQQAEKLAITYLKTKNDLEDLISNVKLPIYESVVQVDIIGKYKNTIIAFEVKMRNNDTYWPLSISQYNRIMNGLLFNYSAYDIQVDLIIVNRYTGIISHFENITY